MSGQGGIAPAGRGPAPAKPPAASKGTYDSSQRAGERQSQGAGTNYTWTEDHIVNGVIHRVTFSSVDGKSFDDKIIGRVPLPSRLTGTSYGVSGSSGPTWYERQQVALEQQRLADARAAQAAQNAYQAQQVQVSQSNAVEAANQSYRDAQLKSYYGTINGMAYASPKGAPFAEMLPEPALLKQAYAANHQPDPWLSPARYPGYTGSTFSNAQHPGLVDAGGPTLQGAGLTIPTPQQPKVETVGDDPNLMNLIETHPNANQFVMSLPGATDFVANHFANTGTPNTTGGQA